MKHLTHWIALAALGIPGAFGQSLDSSGNGLLKGTFQFRQLQISDFDQNSGAPTETAAVSGTITFDGSGKYTIAGNVKDNTVSGGAPQSLKVNGTYAIGGNGVGFIDNPLDSQDSIFGAVGQGVFVGSSTEGVVDNTFIAIQPAATPSNTNFSGSYWTGVLDFPSGSSSALKNALFQLSPNGQGAFGTITLKGQAADQTVPVVTQSVAGATYTFPGDGTIALSVPAPSGTNASALFQGSKSMFVSTDGNYVLGYTANGYDLFFGVKALTSNATPGIYSGLYYFSALEDTPGSSGNCGDVDAFYGSLLADGNNNQIQHQRLTSVFCSTIDYQIDDQTSISQNGNATDFNGYQYAFGNGGQAFVAIGSNGFYSLMVGVHANTFTGSGVFLNPTGITNAASFAPITSSVAGGELVTLYGSGLATTTQTMQGGQPFPNILGGVQVLVNGTAAPIYYVSPTQISAVLPYAIDTVSLASIQVNNNGTKSNPITLYTTDAIPGVFSQSQNGLGLAAALHAATGQLVTRANPAIPGEYLSVYLTGLGTVSPTIKDGALGPTNPLSYADVYNAQSLSVFFDDYDNQLFPEANVTFAGLAPGLAGLYQINVQVPTVGLGPGNIYLEIATDFADVNQIQVPVAVKAQSTALTPQAQPKVRKMHGKPVAQKPNALKKHTASPRSRLSEPRQ